MNFCSVQMPARQASQYLLAGLALALLPGLAPGQVVDAAAQQPMPQPATSDSAQVHQALQGLAMPFEANSGQFDKRVAFVGRTFAGPVYVTRQGQIVYSLPGAKAEAQHEGKAEPQPGWNLTETLVDARALKPYGGEQASAKVSRFAGAKSYQAATYRNIYLGQAWPGIEVELAASTKGGSNVEKLFHVKPYADAERIQVRLDGAESLRLGEKGELIARTGHGDVAYTAPAAFQQVGGKRFDVPVKYVLNKAGDGYSFVLGMYDRTRPLVIDPLLQSSYLGGSQRDYIAALVVDAQTGDILVSGRADSPDFPGTAGGAQPGMNDTQSGFVARLSGDLKTLRQSTYLGGSDWSEFRALAIDAATGDVLVAGFTWGARDFPGTEGGAQTRASGGVVARLSGDLKTLRQSTYLGGGFYSGDAYALVIDAATGDVLVGGNASRMLGTEGGAQPGAGGGQDGFIARLSGDLKALRQSTYLGGSGLDEINSLAIDTATGDVLVGGFTSSPDFPGTVGGAKPGPGGGQDGFITRLSGDLKTLRQSTYLGGSGDDVLYGLITETATGDVLVGGTTSSSNFPGVAGGAQPGFGGEQDGLVARLSGDLKTLRQSTYLGGSSLDYVKGLTMDPVTGDVLVGGFTYSTDFPGTAGGVQSGQSGGQDGALARLSGDLQTLRQSTYLMSGWINGLAIDAGTGDVLVAGTASDGLPGTAGAAQPSYGGSQDGFVSRLTGDLKALSPQAITFPAQASHEFASGGTFAIDPAATANSGLPVSYASTTPGICTVSGTTVTMVSAGTCTVVASQGGNTQWEAAADVAVDIVLKPDSGNGGGGEGGNGGEGGGSGGNGGTGPAQAAPVPVLGPLGLVLMSLLAGGMGLRRLRRQT